MSPLPQLETCARENQQSGKQNASFLFLNNEFSSGPYHWWVISTIQQFLHFEGQTCIPTRLLVCRGLLELPQDDPKNMPWDAKMKDTCWPTLLRSVLLDMSCGSGSQWLHFFTNTSCWTLLSCTLLRVPLPLWIKNALCSKTDLPPSSWGPRIPRGRGDTKQWAARLAQEACFKGIIRNSINIPP